MRYTGGFIGCGDAEMIQFSEKYYPQYERVYNECFYEMRRALDIEPYNFLSDISQLNGKRENIFLLTDNGTIIGSAACYGTEIDDLIVNKAYQGRGFGRRLLLWAIDHIRGSTDEPITLHAAAWNEKAVSLYERSGFVIAGKETIIRE